MPSWPLTATCATLFRKTAQLIPATISPCTTKSLSATPATSTKSPKRPKPPKTSTSRLTPTAKAKPSPGISKKSCTNAVPCATKTSTASPSTKSPKTPSSRPLPTRVILKWISSTPNKRGGRWITSLVSTSHHCCGAKSAPDSPPAASNRLPCA